MAMILSEVKTYCENILTTTKCRELPFHNLAHTCQVVNQVQIIGKNMGLVAEEIQPITIAAWFHDTGFCEAYKGHEDVSIELATTFLQRKGYPTEKTKLIVACIEATKIPQNPINKYAEVLSDADIYHISEPAFFYRKLLLRREWELEFELFSTEFEWHELNLEFLQSHQFFTEYGKKVLMKGKQENEAKVKNLIRLYK